MINKTTILHTLLIGVMLLFLSGCANRAVATRDPSFQLENIKALHIQNSEDAWEELIPMIEAKLREFGYTEITSGDEVAPDADAVITYKDHWAWDLTMYMIELTITVRDKDSWQPLATGNSMHTSLSRLSDKEMVDEVLTNIFRPGT